MGLSHQLAVAARRWAHVRAQGAEALQPDASTFETDFRALMKRAGTGLMRSHALVRLPVNEPPWFDTGLDLNAGETVTLLAAGRAFLSKALDLWVGPQFQLWARVGENGFVRNGVGESQTFHVAEGGRLYLASYFPGQWGDRTGRLSTALNDYAGIAGGFSVGIIRWAGDAREGLRALAGTGDAGGLIKAELARLENPVPPPAGWNYLWLLGQSDIYRHSLTDGKSCITCHTHRNVGILQKDAPFALMAGTKLSWSWKVDALPSVLPEDTALSHDYLSIAVEFNDGRDITYYWSRELPEGTGYWCPLPTWKDREFHVVVRTGARDLGRWISEERDLHADYLRYIGKPPARIVRVWLIAVSLFQRREGRAHFADIALGGDGARLQIF